jgi:hypothetical protein
LVVIAGLFGGLSHVAAAACPFRSVDLPYGDLQVVNNHAVSDSGHDANPQLATDGSGRWVVIWESNDDLGGTIDTDWELLVSVSTNGGNT